MGVYVQAPAVQVTVPLDGSDVLTTLVGSINPPPAVVSFCSTGIVLVWPWGVFVTSSVANTPAVLMFTVTDAVLQVAAFGAARQTWYEKVSAPVWPALGV